MYPSCFACTTSSSRRIVDSPPNKTMCAAVLTMSLLNPAWVNSTCPLASSLRLELLGLLGLQGPAATAAAMVGCRARLPTSSCLLLALPLLCFCPSTAAAAVVTCRAGLPASSCLLLASPLLCFCPVTTAAVTLGCRAGLAASCCLLLALPSSMLAAAWLSSGWLSASAVRLELLRLPQGLRFAAAAEAECEAGLSAFCWPALASVFSWFCLSLPSCRQPRHDSEDVFLHHTVHLSFYECSV